MTTAFMAFLHHLFAFTLAACLVYEFVAYHRNMTIDEAQRIQRVDLAYGISAGLLLIIGLLRVFFYEKGPGFYAQSPFFWVKMITFAIVGSVIHRPDNSLHKMEQAFQAEFAARDQRQRI